MPRECVSHHHACDCREAKFKQLLALAKFGQEIIKTWDNTDAFWIQDIALRHRLIEWGNDSLKSEFDLTPLATLPEGIE